MKTNLEGIQEDSLDVYYIYLKNRMAVAMNIDELNFILTPHIWV